MTIKDELDQAVRLRPAVEGGPTQGPYPATVGEAADEVVAWVREMDKTSARGLALAIHVRLGGAFVPEAQEERS